jgi:hypothetical protein
MGLRLRARLGQRLAAVTAAVAGGAGSRLGCIKRITHVPIGAGLLRLRRGLRDCRGSVPMVMDGSCEG